MRSRRFRREMQPRPRSHDPRLPFPPTSTVNQALIMPIPHPVRLPTRIPGSAFLALVLVLMMPTLRAAGTIAQTIVLNPGWNAVHFTVLPTDPSLDVVFNGADVDSVWAHDNGAGSPDFIQEVSEPALAKAGWRSWVPSSRPEAFQNDLFRIEANRAYLVKLKGAAQAQLPVSGRPSLRSVVWQPDALNFRGLPVDPSLPPTTVSGGIHR